MICLITLLSELSESIENYENFLDLESDKDWRIQLIKHSINYFGIVLIFSFTKYLEINKKDTHTQVA